MYDFEWQIDSYEYQAYYLENWRNGNGPSLIAKTSRVIAAVVQNQPDLLRELLDDPKWYYVKDRFNYCLLRIAIYCSNVEVFDVMLSLPDFPLELLNEDNETAFELAFRQSENEHSALELVVRESKNDHFTCALILAGANLDLVTARLRSGVKLSEFVFENCVSRESPEVYQETLFFLLFDQHSKLKLDLRVLLKLAERRSSLVVEVVKFGVPIRFMPDLGLVYFYQLCSLDADYLKLILDNFSPYLKKALPSDAYNFHSTLYIYQISLECLVILLESDLHNEATYVLSCMHNYLTYEHFESIADVQDINAEEFYLCFLSYGLRVTVLDLNMVYRRYGYSNFFKTLLYMDVKQPFRYFVLDVIVDFIHDVNMDLETFFEDPKQYFHQEHLSMYFRHPLLTELLAAQRSEESTADNEKEENGETESQLVPRLLELARNAFRASVAHRFNHCGQFYAFLRNLDIPEDCKKIISFERPVYC